MVQRPRDRTNDERPGVSSSLRGGRCSLGVRLGTLFVALLRLGCDGQEVLRLRLGARPPVPGSARDAGRVSTL
jgi:hypothetical protein